MTVLPRLKWTKPFTNRYVSTRGYSITRAAAWKRSQCWTAHLPEGGTLTFDRLWQAKEACERHADVAAIARDEARVMDPGEPRTQLRAKCYAPNCNDPAQRHTFDYWSDGYAVGALSVNACRSHESVLSGGHITIHDVRKGPGNRVGAGVLMEETQ